MSDNTMPERLWVQRLSTDENEMSWYEGWETKDEEPMFPETEYVRADVAAAQLAFMREDRNLYYGIAQQQTEAIEQLSARIAELEAAQAWVSVDERLPEPLADVLVVYGDYCVRGWLSEKAVWYMGLHPIPVTHWMPLPPPPVASEA